LRATAARLRGILRHAAADAPRGFNVESLPGYDHGTGHAKPDESVAAIVDQTNSRLLWKAAGREILGKVWNPVARGRNTQSCRRQGARKQTFQHVILLCEFDVTISA
jgi:hypothetical protein